MEKTEGLSGQKRREIRGKQMVSGACSQSRKIYMPRLQRLAQCIVINWLNEMESTRPGCHT